MSTLPELIAARDAALLAWYAAGPASLSAEADAAWAAYKAASAVVARGQSSAEPVDTNPLPPPPPPDVLIAAAQAAEAATATFYALADDPAAGFYDVYAAWDTAVAAENTYRRLIGPEQLAAKWAGVRRVLGDQS